MSMNKVKLMFLASVKRKTILYPPHIVAEMCTIAGTYTHTYTHTHTERERDSLSQLTTTTKSFKHTHTHTYIYMISTNIIC